MFNEGITGTGIHDINVRFRMYLVVVVGIFAFGSVLYWRSQTLVAAEYVDFPTHSSKVKAGSANYEVEYLEEALK